MPSLFGKDNQFYHGSIKRYVGLFGSLFTDMYVQRKGPGGRVDFVEVPIKYGNGDVYMKVAQDESREQTKVQRVVPAMAFELSNVYKDTQRKTNPMNVIKNYTYEADGTRQWMLNRVPYNFVFNLYIRTKNLDDMLQIVEQIVPAFDGNLAVTIEDIPNTEIQVEQDIMIKIEEIDMNDNYQDEMKGRQIDFTITFELKGYLYKRTQSSFAVREVAILGAYDFETGEVSPEVEIASYTEQIPIDGEQQNLSNVDNLINKGLASFGGGVTL